MNEKARIGLAEAMGWTRAMSHGKPQNGWCPPNLEYKIWLTAEELPNPFTDANDDYAVLEWMRKQKSTASDDTFLATFNALLGYMADYEIGDYARAACAVLNIEVEK